MFSNSSQVLTLACPCPVRMRSLRSTPHSSPDSQTWRVFLLFFNYSLFPNETRFQGFFILQIPRLVHRYSFVSALDQKQLPGERRDVWRQLDVNNKQITQSKSTPFKKYFCTYLCVQNISVMSIFSTYKV